MDMYLRILKAIDEEVVDRDLIRSQQVNFVNCFYIYVTISMGYHQTEIYLIPIQLELYTVEPCFTDTRFIRTVSFVPTKSSYIFSKINPLYTDTG